MNTLLRAKAPHSGTVPRQLNETASKQAVEIEHLRKTHGTLVAVDELIDVLGLKASARTTTGPCPAASDSACPSCWPSSASRRSRYSTR